MMLCHCYGVCDVRMFYYDMFNDDILVICYDVKTSFQIMSYDVFDGMSYDFILMTSHDGMMYCHAMSDVMLSLWCHVL